MARLAIRMLGTSSLLTTRAKEETTERIMVSTTIRIMSPGLMAPMEYDLSRRSYAILNGGVM